MKKMPQPNTDDAPGVTAEQAANMSAESDTVELPDARSLGDAIKQWQQKDELEAAENSSTDKSAKNNVDASDSSAGAARNSTRKVSRNQTRRFARQRALQALYQWDCGDVDVSDVLNQFKEHQDLNNVDLEHFQLLFRGVALSVDEVDVLLEPALDRPVADLDPIERSVLRMAACELRDSLETPARVVINEAVELTKRFGADQGHKYVNGVIDKVAVSVRAAEMKASRKI